MLCQVCLCLESGWMLGYHVVNKLHLGSSLRSPSVDSITEYTTLKINPAVSRLLCLRQSGQAIEEYVVRFL